MRAVFKVLLLCTVVSANRPLAWENEDFVPVAPRQETPEFLWDVETDPGGYVMYGTYNMVLFPNGVTEDDLPYVPHDTLFAAWLLKMFSLFPPTMPMEVWNCTAYGFEFPSNEFLGEFNGNRICDLGACCQEWVNLGYRYAEDTIAWHSTIGDNLKIGMCKESEMQEEIYCIEVNGQTHINCFEMRPTPGAHDMTLPCMDSMVQYYMTHCPVFKNVMTGKFGNFGYETPIYLSRSTNEELISLDGTLILPDVDICAPYSYYNPATSKATSSSSPKIADVESSAKWVFSLSLLALL